VSAHVIRNFFTQQHNKLEAAKQAYQLAKAHKREVMNLPTWDRQRFHEAMDRESEAREIYLSELLKR
jgi:hypothetical protein